MENLDEKKEPEITETIEEQVVSPEEPKPKKKIVWAKNRAEGIWAVIVTTIFILFTTYNVVTYVNVQKEEASQAVKETTVGPPVPLAPELAQPASPKKTKPVKK